MKKALSVTLGIGLLGAALCLAPNKARSATTQEEATEVNVSAVFLPQHGFDDNDHIVMVLTGELPHICYTLGETKIEKEGHVIRVHQYAWIRKTGFCGNGDLDPDLAANFETEVSLGQLETGKYEIQFHQDENKLGTRSFGIAVAETADIDDYAYAAVTDIISPKVIFDDEQVKVVIQGTLNSTCEHLQEPLRVEKQGDVFVVMPIIDRGKNQPCRRQRTEFHHELNLGVMHTGSYLVHVRAMNGKAVNRILGIYKKP